MALEEDDNAVKRIHKARVGLALDKLLDALDGKGLPANKPRVQTIGAMLNERFRRRRKREEKEW